MGFLSFGRIFHLSVDFIFISIILAGVKCCTGFELAPESVAHAPDSISFVKKYLRFGEYLFQTLCNHASTSSLFKRATIKELTDNFSQNLLRQAQNVLNTAEAAYDKLQTTENPAESRTRNI